MVWYGCNNRLYFTFEVFFEIIAVIRLGLPVNWLQYRGCSYLKSGGFIFAIRNIQTFAVPDSGKQALVADDYCEHSSRLL